MKKTLILAAAAVLAAFSFWLQREFLRGTFDPVERRFVAWLSANTAGVSALPPLTVVLYDTEASELAGVSRMGVLDGALFARAAAKLGALAAGVEGLEGNPSRMLEAAGRMPLFGAFAADNPPGIGWTPWLGTADAGWPELPGLAGPASVRFSRGFFAPPEGSSGPRRIALIARNSAQPVPSFLALAWASAQELPPAGRSAEPRKLAGRGRFLPIDVGGSAWFFPESGTRVMSMNELLVLAEKHEREGDASPLRGGLIVLASATPDVARFKGVSDAKALTPGDLWAQSWPALRRNRFFVLPGWWYPVFLSAAALLLCLGPGRGSARAAVLAGAAVVLVFLLAAIGVFATAGLLLPFVPSVATLLGGLLLGKFFARRRAVDGS